MRGHRWLSQILTVATGLVGSIAAYGLQPAFAQVQDNRQECDAPTTQSQINLCAGQAADKVDQELNQVYQQISLNTRNEQKHSLTESQQAWIKFRDAHCAFERSFYTGGTLSTAVYLTCLEKLTRQRLQQIEPILAQQKSH